MAKSDSTDSQPLDASLDDSHLQQISSTGLGELRASDTRLFELLENESRRQANTLVMVAASSMAPPSVLSCEGSPLSNVTTEGYPGARFHAGCEIVDEIERLAIKRAKTAFNAQYANVQPHSGSSANAVVMFGLLQPNDIIMGQDLDAGGHLTHGAKPSVTSKYFRSVSYGVDSDGLLDYESIAALAREHNPKLIICGASAYPRAIDFARFREIADEVNAYLLADISHIAGLVVAGMHDSPIDHAHITTTSTYKQLYGPRGGLILMGRDHMSLKSDSSKTLADVIQKSLFPYFQGTPHLASIAAKANALELIQSTDFSTLAQRIIDSAKCLAAALDGRGYRVVTGGTDNHMVLIDTVTSLNLTGVVAERALEMCNIIVNKNKIFDDKNSAMVTSGVRFGTNTLALRGLGIEQMVKCAELVDEVLTNVNVLGDQEFELDSTFIDAIRVKVQELCDEFPIPNYP